MSQLREKKNRTQRFKIQVIKKKVARIQSTPQKQSIKSCNRLQRMFQQKTQIGIKEKELEDKNPQESRSILINHLKTKSELTNFCHERIFCLQEFQTELGRESIIINSFPLQNICKYSDQSFDDGDFGHLKIIDKKMSDQRGRKSSQRYKFNPFESLNVVKCQSITLIQGCRKNKTNLGPSAFLNKQCSVSRRNIRLKVASCSKIMNINVGSDADSMYIKKLKNHLDFLFKVNYSNKIYIPFQLHPTDQLQKYKVYVGWGNNHYLVRNCLKSRFWIELVEKAEEPDVRFYWTSWFTQQFYSKQKDIRKVNGQCFELNKQPHNIDADTLRCNQKILMGRQVRGVQNFITSNGYIIPFSEYNRPAAMTNHLSGSSHMCQKKKLFHSLFRYYSSWLKSDPFKVIPVTYNVTGKEDPEYKRFMRDNADKEDKIWIVKPGENTNRGEGICLAKTEDVGKCIDERLRQTYVIQSYIERPLLYNGRKFDVRHFLLLTSVNGNIKAYWFKQGYIRTSSELFDLSNLADRFTHLTNDAIQQHSKNYGMSEPANKLSYKQFQRYLETIFPKRRVSFQVEILDKVKEIILNVIKANYKSLDKKQKQANFQLFGIDFMIDRDLNPWLIEINENPCLETNCQLLSRLIPSVIQNTLRLCLDPLFPPLNHFPSKLRSSLNDHYLKTLKYQIIFDQCVHEQQNSGKGGSFHQHNI